MADNNALELFLASLSEGFTVEVKNWIPTDKPEGIAKIARAALALRNENGGHLVFGFNDADMRPDPDRPPDIRLRYHADVIQKIVSDYAYEHFPVEVQFPQFQEKEFPVITVPNGVRTPVACKADLYHSDGNRKLLRRGAIYSRTLATNHTFSTAEATPGDWSRLIEHCFENREADIGRFLRRHLTPEAVRMVLNSFSEDISSVGDNSAVKSLSYLAVNQRQSANLSEPEFKLLDAGFKRFEESCKRSKREIPKVGYFEIAITVVAVLKEAKANRDLLTAIGAHNRRLTGWPFFIPLTNAQDETLRPYTYDGGWEQCAIRLDRDPFLTGVDFWRITPKGEMYHVRGFDDDFKGKAKGVAPGTTLDRILPIWRVGDAIAEGLALAKIFSADAENGSIAVSLRWKGLAGRKLGSWANPRYWSTEPKSVQDVAINFLEIPISAADSSLFQYVHKALEPLYAAFDGTEMSIGIVEEEMQKLLKIST